jgi:hypothetical protein
MGAVLIRSGHVVSRMGSACSGGTCRHRRQPRRQSIGLAGRTELAASRFHTPHKFLASRLRGRWSSCGGMDWGTRRPVDRPWPTSLQTGSEALPRGPSQVRPASPALGSCGLFRCLEGAWQRAWRLRPAVPALIYARPEAAGCAFLGAPPRALLRARLGRRSGSSCEVCGRTEARLQAGRITGLVTTGLVRVECGRPNGGLQWCIR